MPVIATRGRGPSHPVSIIRLGCHAPPRNGPPTRDASPLAGGLLFVASLLYFGASYVVAVRRRAGAGRSPGWRHARSIVALFTAFALHHSVFARAGLKSWIRRAWRRRRSSDRSTSGSRACCSSPCARAGSPSPACGLAGRRGGRVVLRSLRRPRMIAAMLLWPAGSTCFDARRRPAGPRPRAARASHAARADAVRTPSSATRSTSAGGCSSSGRRRVMNGTRLVFAVSRASRRISFAGRAVRGARSAPILRRVVRRLRAARALAHRPGVYAAPSYR